MIFFQKKLIQKVFLLYTFSFFIIFYLGYMFIASSLHKSLIWSADAFTNDYPVFIYFHYFFQSVVHSIFSNHSLNFIQWDHAIGYGSDVHTVLNAWMFDPFMWLAYWVNPKKAEMAFNFIISIKIYLIGAAFCIYGLFKRYSFISIVTGGLFAAFSIPVVVGMKQPFFLNAFYIFPILMIGVEKLWVKKFSILYVLVLAFFFINSYYFTYMALAFIAIYCFVRFIVEDRNTGIKGFIKLFSRYFFPTIIALGLSAFAYLPIVSNVLQTHRVSSYMQINLFYGIKQALYTLFGFITFYDNGNDTIWGFSPIALIFILFFIFYRGKGFFTERIVLLVLTVGMFLPLFGKMMNGFSYSSNRWIFIYLFCLTNLIMGLLPEFLECKKSMINKIFVGICAYLLLFLLAYKLHFYSHPFTKMFILSIAFVFISFILIFGNQICRHFIFNYTNSRYPIIFTCIILSLLWGLSFTMNPRFAPYMIENVDNGSAYNLMHNSAGESIIFNASDRNTFRYDSNRDKKILNSSWAFNRGIGGFNFYAVSYNDHIDQFNKSVGLNCLDFYDMYNGLDARSELLHVMGAKYFITSDSNMKPFGYDKLVKKENIGNRNYMLYESKFPVCLGYKYQWAISDKQFDELSPDKQEQVMLHAISLNPDFANADLTDFPLADNEINYEIGKMQNAELVNRHTIKLLKPNSSFELVFPEINQAEVSLILKTRANFITNNINFDGMQDDKILKTNHNNMDTMQGSLSGGKTKWLINMGFLQEPINRIRITSANPIEFDLRDLRVIRKTPEQLDSDLNALRPLDTPVTITTNRVKAEVTNSKSEFVFFSIPFSKGWKGFLDGNPCNILLADKAFMAIKVPEGKHEIQLCYDNPYTQMGIYISVFSVIIFIGYVVLEKKSLRNVS